MSCDEATQCERHRSRDHVAGEHDQKTPPQTKEKTAPHSEDAPWQQKDITSCKKQRVANCGPHAPAHHTLLQRCNKTDDRKKMGKRHSKRNRTDDRASLPKNNAAGTEHPEIVRESPSLRKFLQLRINELNDTKRAPSRKYHCVVLLQLHSFKPLRFDPSEC